MWSLLIAIIAAFAFLYGFNYVYNRNELRKLQSKDDVILEKEYSETEMAKRIGIAEIKNNMITELNENVVAAIRYSTDEFNMLDDAGQDEYENALISFALSLNFDIKIIEIPKVISGKTIVAEMKVFDNQVDENKPSPIDVYRKKLIEAIETEEKRVALEKVIACFTRNEKDKTKKLKLLRERVDMIQQTLPFKIEILDTNALIELNALMLRKKNLDVEEIEKTGGFELHA